MEVVREVPARPEVREKRRLRRGKRFRTSSTQILLPTIRETEVAFTVPAHLLGPDQAQLRTAPADRGSFFSGAAQSSPETMAYYYVAALPGSRLKISATVSEEPVPGEGGAGGGLLDTATASESEYASASEEPQEPPSAAALEVTPERAGSAEEAATCAEGLGGGEDLVAGESCPEGESDPDGKAGQTRFRLHWSKLLKPRERRPAAAAGPALPQRGGQCEEVVAVVTLPLSRSSSFASDASDVAGGSPEAQHEAAASSAAAAHFALSSMIADTGFCSPASLAAAEAPVRRRPPARAAQERAQMPQQLDGGRAGALAAAAGAAAPGGPALARQRNLQLRVSIEADAGASSATESSEDEGACSSAGGRQLGSSLRREGEGEGALGGLIHLRSDSAFRGPDTRLPPEPACKPASPGAPASDHALSCSPLSPRLRAPHGMLSPLPPASSALAARGWPGAATPLRRAQALQDGSSGLTRACDSMAAAMSQSRTPEQLQAEIARRRLRLAKLVAVHGAWCKALQRPGSGRAPAQEGSLTADDSARVSDASDDEAHAWLESASDGAPSSSGSGSDARGSQPVTTLRLRGGAVYRGQLSARGTPQGLGSYEVWSPNPSGPGGRTDRYQGEFQSGRMHGSGVYAFADNGWYSGEWIGGRQQGYGQRVFASGTACLGSFGCAGSLAGHGACFYPTGDSFQGEFRAGMPHGKGQHKAADGAHYAGSFHRGRRAGLGVYRFPSGDTFAGGFRDDAPHGLGIYTLASGERLEAEFCGGEVHGWGVRVLPCGLMAAGKWERGRLLWSRVLRREHAWEEGLADADAEGIDAAQEVARNARHTARLAGRAARAARDEPGAATAAVRASLAAAERAEAAAAQAARLAAL